MDGSTGVMTDGQVYQDGRQGEHCWNLRELTESLSAFVQMLSLMLNIVLLFLSDVLSCMLVSMIALKTCLPSINLLMLYRRCMEMWNAALTARSTFSECHSWI